MGIKSESWMEVWGENSWGTWHVLGTSSASSFIPSLISYIILEMFLSALYGNITNWHTEYISSLLNHLFYQSEDCLRYQILNNSLLLSDGIINECPSEISELKWRSILYSVVSIPIMTFQKISFPDLTESSVKLSCIRI